tara:strand:- start:956 stop:1420 length:465 start_codon:yes stop_codon:yes gene_type:complete
MIVRGTQTIKGLRLIKVNDKRSHANTLFTILKNRKKKENISHKKLPTLSEHIKFIKSKPYRYWFIVEKEKKLLGTLYITRNNVISIKLLKKNKKIFIELLTYVSKNIKPLGLIPTVRNPNFSINLSPENKYYANLLLNIGAKKIQETYLLNEEK